MECSSLMYGIAVELQHSASRLYISLCCITLHYIRLYFGISYDINDIILYYIILSNSILYTVDIQIHGSLQQEGRFKLFVRSGLKPTMLARFWMLPLSAATCYCLFDHPDPTLPKESDLCCQESDPKLQFGE